jgi:hypothetical protein
MSIAKDLATAAAMPTLVTTLVALVAAMTTLMAAMAALIAAMTALVAAMAALMAAMTRAAAHAHAARRDTVFEPLHLELLLTRHENSPKTETGENLNFAEH